MTDAHEPMTDVSRSIADINGLMNDEYIPISLIAQYLYCPRRAALIALHGEWEDNEYTAAGTIGHAHVHLPNEHHHSQVFHSVHVVSKKLGLTGVCDRVDYVQEKDGRNMRRLEPIEFKHGKRRNEREYEAQLCAQAICLEEMHDCEIPKGYLYFITEKRRKEIALTEELRSSTRQAITQIRDMLRRETLPPAEKTPKCKRCSLNELCVPECPPQYRSQEYWKQLMSFAGGGEDI